VVLASAVVAIAWPAYWPYAYAAATVFLVIPLVILLALVALPLKAKSVVRLIDMGYPANTKEMAIRVAARKLHEQSIESEELLVQTALNESRKLLRKYRERAERLKQELEEAEREAKDAAKQAKQADKD
jgi:Na+/phosphate symporter